MTCVEWLSPLPVSEMERLIMGVVAVIIGAFAFGIAAVVLAIVYVILASLLGIH